MSLFLVALISLGQMRRSTEINIPMDLSTSRPIVEVMIGDKGPYKFIFDTGSATNVLDKQLADELGFDVVGSDELKTQGPQRLTSQRVAVSGLGFPGTNISKDVEMNVVDLRSMLPVDGVMSSLFFKEFLLTIDYPNSVLNVALGELDANEKGVSSIIQNPRTINYNLEVDGLEVEAHLDTGSPGGFSLPHSLKDKLKFKDGLTKGGEIRTPVAGYQPWHAQLDGNIKVGDMVFRNPDLLLVEGFEYANLGFKVAKNFRITIDRKNGLIRFAQGKSSGPRKTKVKRAAQPSASYGGTYEGDRKVFKDDSGVWSYQRAGAPIALQMSELEKDYYKMVVPGHVRAPMEIPNIRFLRNDDGEVTSIEMVYKERTDGPFKKLAN